MIADPRHHGGNCVRRIRQSVRAWYRGRPTICDLVRAAGVEPAQALRPYGFSYPLRLSPPDPCACARRNGLGSGLSLHLGRAALGAARLVSTPSRFRAWLGIAIRQVSPNLGSSASSVSRRALKFGLSPLRLPVSPRPRVGNSYSFAIGVRQ